MVAFIGKEWGYSSGSTRSIVVGKFSKGKELRPVVLLAVAEYSEELLEGLVKMFCLTGSFWVVT